MTHSQLHAEPITDMIMKYARNKDAVFAVCNYSSIFIDAQEEL